MGDCWRQENVPLFALGLRQWSCGKTASGLERMLCAALVRRQTSRIHE